MAAVERKRIVFLCSGGGGNLRFVQRAIERGWIAHAVIAEVITDRECPANAFACAAGIPNRVVDFGEAGQTQVLAALAQAEPDLVVTTVHRILKEQVVAAFRGRLLNLHYSLLPAFGGAIGARPVQAALDYGACFVGATAHEVDETVDGGRPVVQAAVPVRPQDSAASLMDLVFRCGCIALGSAINVRLDRIAPSPETALFMKDRLCLFSAPLCVPEAAAQDEALWAELAATPDSR
jgi:phosphoribosylglycinamide formyltransferase-1